jgi:hypothetical protein
MDDDTGMYIYHQFSTAESAILQGLEALKTKKDAFHALIPGPLAAFGSPQGIIHDKLLVLKTSVMNFRLAIFAVLPPSVSENLFVTRYCQCVDEL